MKLTRPSGWGSRYNYRITLDPGGVQGSMVAQYHQCMYDEKFLTAPFVETGIHYNIIAPPVVYVGQSFWITVEVIDNGGGIKTDYAATTAFTSTDPGALMDGSGMGTTTANYLWTGAGGDDGVHIFVNVVMTSIGIQTIVASDTADGSILGLGSVMVVGVDVKLTKEPRLTVAASGDTVQFKICWSNYSTTTAFNFVITDAVPESTTYVPDPATAMDCGNTNGVIPDVAYSTSTSATPPATFTTTGGTPPGSSRWLRWTYGQVAINTTGCACFRVRVD